MTFINQVNMKKLADPQGLLIACLGIGQGFVFAHILPYLLTTKKYGGVQGMIHYHKDSSVRFQVFFSTHT